MLRILTILLLFPVLLQGQAIDHWETVVYDNDIWKYRTGFSEPPSDWMQVDFDDTAWPSAQGGIGYGDDDDGTIATGLLSLYIRKEFDLVDTALINYALLHADYDDAFVAYLNGVEIARSSNIGTVGTPPPYNATLTVDHEAQLYQGGSPDAFLFSGIELENLMKQGSNTLAIQIHNVNTASSDFSSNFFFSVGIADNSMTYGETPPWFSSPFFSTNLPLIVITTTQTTEIFDEPKVPAHMGIVDNGGGALNSPTDSFNLYDGNISIEIRGASSQLFPKKGYGFETQLEDGSNNNVSLFGMPAENDWILHGPYTDKSLLRNVLAYHMGAKTGRYTPRTQLCELIINNDYRGVYMFTERIKRDEGRVDIATVNPEDIAGDELTGGYLFQIDRDNDQVEGDGWFSSYPDFKFFAFDDPDYDELLPVQKDYIKDYMDDFEYDMNTAAYGTRYLDYVDVDSWVDYFLINEIGKHIDAFKLSFFMYKRKDSNGGKLHFGPIWDFNLAFGNFDFECSPDPAGWAYQFWGNCTSWHPFWIPRLVEIPNVSHQTNCRWEELRAGPLRTDSLMQFIDENVALLTTAQERNFERWPVLGIYVWPNDYVGNNYEEEINFLKNWLTQRLEWMDNNMIGDCGLLNNLSSRPSIPSKVELYPNPASAHIIVNVYDTDFQQTTLEIYDALGRVVDTYDIGEPEALISVSHFTNGVYSYKVLEGDSIVGTGRFLKF